MSRLTCVAASITLTLFLTSAMSAAADEGIPALLQFADKWQAQRDTAALGSREKSVPATGYPDVAERPAPQAELSEVRQLRKAVQDLQQRLSGQTVIIREKTQEMDRLRTLLSDAQVAQAVAGESVPPLGPLPDLSLFRQMMVSVREALGGTPQEKAAAERIASLKMQLAQSRKALEISEERAGELKQAKADITTELAGLETELNTLQEKQTETGQQLALLEAGRPALVSEAMLDAEPLRVSYAAGSALGADLLSVVEERETAGVELDREILLAGVNDVFRDELVLAPETLHQVLAAAEESQAQTRTARIEEGARRDKRYVASFRKQKGVKSSPSGFWYRVEYAGDEVIPNDAVVDVVVKETLTDGTVIQDMEVSQRVMSQRLSAYPPLFREAIGYVKNHGTVTLVVPPELAYGDEGYPPKVLPGATMVYELRVSDVSAGEV